MNRRDFVKIMFTGTIVACTNPVKFIKLIRKKGIRETYEEAKRRVLLQHTLEMERALCANLFGMKE